MLLAMYEVGDEIECLTDQGVRRGVVQEVFGVPPHNTYRVSTGLAENRLMAERHLRPAGRPTR
jgi:hypothetical protein